MQGKHQNPNRQDGIAELIDGETGEVLTPEDIGSFDNADDVTREMFEPREGRSQDGSIWLPKITMATIRVRPARCWELDGGRGAPFKAAIFAGVANGTKIMENVEKTESFTALTGEFSAIRFDLQGEPDAIFKSDTMFLPIGHLAAVNRLERQQNGVLNFSLEFSSNPRGEQLYSWSYRNLAQIDRNNLSPIDRLISYSVNASRMIGERPQGLLADLRRDPEKIAAN